MFLIYISVIAFVLAVVWGMDVLIAKFIYRRKGLSLTTPKYAWIMIVSALCVSVICSIIYLAVHYV